MGNNDRIHPQALNVHVRLDVDVRPVEEKTLFVHTSRPTDGGKDLAPRDATAGARQDDAATTRSTVPSQSTTKHVPEGPFNDPLPGEEVFRIKRGHVSLDTETLPRIPCFDNSTHLTDALNNSS